MNYEEECIEAFRNDMLRQNFDKRYLDSFVSAFKSGFEFGSLNGASNRVKKFAVNSISPKKKTVGEMLEAINEIRKKAR